MTNAAPIISVGMTISDQEFAQLSRLIHDKIGINLPPVKKQLLIVRLQHLLQERGFTTFGAYHDYVLQDQSGVALSELATRISTNFTYFYREPAHFDLFVQRLLPMVDHAMKAAHHNRVRVWCAGCSSGEEAYLLAMLMREYYGAAYAGLDAGVLATDISTKMLRTAAQAEYTAESVARLPLPLQQRYFTAAAGGSFRVKDEVSREVTLRRYNLLSEKIPFKTKFHAIFCRNVMIYFDRATRARVVAKLRDLLEEGGYLFIGHAEALDQTTEGFAAIAPAAYIRVGGGEK